MEATRQQLRSEVVRRRALIDKYATLTEQIQAAQERVLYHATDNMYAELGRLVLAREVVVLETADVVENIIDMVCLSRCLFNKDAL
jgi:phage-related minor tail protein